MVIVLGQGFDSPQLHVKRNSLNCPFFIIYEEAFLELGKITIFHVPFEGCYKCRLNQMALH
jgi:hypothetical protein